MQDNNSTGMKKATHSGRVHPASDVDTDNGRESSLGKITNFGRYRKRYAKVRNLDESRYLAGLTQSLGHDFGAIEEIDKLFTISPTSSAKKKMIKRFVLPWLTGRYWGDSKVVGDPSNFPPPNSLPNWDALPAEVAQFFKLLFVLEHRDAAFVTIRLDKEVGERALEAPRGPCDWLAERIVRALKKIGIPAEHLAFSIEFATGQPKTLHKLHIHGAIRIPADLRKQAAEALKKALAPAYKTHGSNQAIRFEEPRKTVDVARYAPKEAALITEHRLHRARAKKLGSSAHRASLKATSGGRRTYSSLNHLLYGNPLTTPYMPDFS